MIYEYPEEFVVPVVYVEDLKEKSMNREWKVEYLQLEKLIIPNEESQEDYKKNKFINSTVEEKLNNDNVKTIIKDIDNDYADSETLRM